MVRRRLVDKPCVRSRVRTRTRGSVGRRGFGPSDPITRSDVALLLGQCLPHIDNLYIKSCAHRMFLCQ